ncbi:MAG: hypothetical protein WC612_01505 [Bdellovibrionales bacterium]
MEDIKTIADILTPCLIALFGFVLLRHVEGIKTKAVRESDYLVKHADYFLTAAQEFLVVHEKALALCSLLSDGVNLGEDIKNTLSEKLKLLLEPMLEIELRLRRYAPFAPTQGEQIILSAKRCNNMLFTVLNKKMGYKSQTAYVDCLSEELFERHQTLMPAG